MSLAESSVQPTLSSANSIKSEAALVEGDTKESLLQRAHSARMTGDWSSAQALYEQVAASHDGGEAEAWLSICCIMARRWVWGCFYVCFWRHSCFWDLL
jgi:hypothetical protein